jgi:hypothetical protein
MTAVRVVLSTPLELMALVVAVALLIVSAILRRRIRRMRGVLARRSELQASTRRMHRWLEQQRAIRAARRRNRPADSESQDMPRRSEA